MSANYETLILDDPAPHVRRVTLNRPAVANALNTQMAKDMVAVFEGFATDTQTRCVILTGAGGRAFCGGADLKERNGMSDMAWHAQHVILERMIRAVIACPMPLIASLNGAAFAGGLEIALGCDFIYAARTVRLALTETSIGIIPGAGGTQSLPRVAGTPRALELILTAQAFSAEDAERWGIVNRLCEPSELIERTLATATAIAGNAPLAVRQAKAAIRKGLGLPLAEAMKVELEAYNSLVATTDRREGIAAFNEKRKPRFTGN